MEITWGQMALPFLPLLAKLLIFGALALLLSMVLPSRNLTATVSGLVMVTSYFMGSLAGLAEELATIMCDFYHVFICLLSLERNHELPVSCKGGYLYVNSGWGEREK